ncbi:uncharacterized protein LOC108627414 [Ceratina calcarata]|uniref:Uncharacterized protein LOC108627414 n=1 Tax=Ceratina calcarata TaxID=156304 RepID=A0AAJ7J4A1_9HYME|nr:uncharacterized protein LOC108627414 [Ceratina calcarata]
MENDLEDDFVITQRRHKERAAAAFAEDLADLRRKRRDMQDRFFDVINLDAEIEKARNTLEQADFAFQRHATKFDNTEENCDDLSSKKFIHLEGLSPKPVPKTIKLVKVPNIDMTSYLPQPAKSKRVRAKIDDNADSKIEDPLNVVAMLPLKRRFSNRKKNVSF